MLDIKQIQNILPHRYPFLLIDRVLEMEEGKRCVALKNVTMNEPFFQGHFPQEPVMPGVLIIEALAQTGAVAMLSMEEFKGKIAFFGGIDKAKFRGKVALSLIESENEYLLIYPLLSSMAPNVWKVFLSILFIGVPVKPKKNALGSANRIFSPRLPS